MQFSPWFAPNYPPPPLPTRESIINEGLKRLEQAKTDQQWAQTWVKTKKSSKYVSLSDYREKLITHAQFLRQYQSALNQSSSELLTELRGKIIQSGEFLYESNRVKTIEQQIRGRKSKRARLRRQKQMKSIDTNDNPSEQPRSQSPITNKKLEDIRSLLRLIEQLQSIRQSDPLIELHQRCTAKLVEYENEMKKKSISFSQDQPEHSDLLRGHENRTNLIEIRREWDEYLTRDGSSLPLKWHEPHLPFDHQWAKYIFK